MWECIHAVYIRGGFVCVFVQDVMGYEYMHALNIRGVCLCVYVCLCASVQIRTSCEYIHTVCTPEMFVGVWE